jgi:hypothetical protein
MITQTLFLSMLFLFSFPFLVNNEQHYFLFFSKHKYVTIMFWLFSQVMDTFLPPTTPISPPTFPPLFFDNDSL